MFITHSVRFAGFELRAAFSFCNDKKTIKLSKFISCRGNTTSGGMVRKETLTVSKKVHIEDLILQVSPEVQMNGHYTILSLINYILVPSSHYDILAEHFN